MNKYFSQQANIHIDKSNKNDGQSPGVFQLSKPKKKGKTLALVLTDIFLSGNSNIIFLYSRNLQKHKAFQNYLPTMALLAEGMSFLDPEGSFTLDFLVSGLWEIMVAQSPEARAILPRSPIFSSKQHTMVPSGMAPTGRMFPI